MSIVSDLVNSAVEMPALLGDIVTNDPIAAVLMACGGLVFAASVGALGYLSLGAVVDLVNPMSA
jgi:hypothetical protein